MNAADREKVEELRAAGGTTLDEVLAVRRECLLCVFLGWTGVHRYRIGDTRLGLAYTATLGLFGVGWLRDCALWWRAWNVAYRAHAGDTLAEQAATARRDYDEGMVAVEARYQQRRAEAARLRATATTPAQRFARMVRSWHG